MKEGIWFGIGRNIPYGLHKQLLKDEAYAYNEVILRLV